MRDTACVPDSSLQNKSMFYGFTDFTKDKTVLPYFEQDLAAFLLIRGPYAWLGNPNNRDNPTMSCYIIFSLIFHHISALET